MSKLIVIVFICLFSPACGSKPTNVPGQFPNNMGAGATNSAQLEQAVVVLDRRFGECLGQCPVYTISIYGTGKVIYEGKENVKTKGKVESKINRSELEQL